MKAHLAFEALSRMDFASVLDIGSGDGEHARAFAEQGRKVTTISLRPPATYIQDYATKEFAQQFDCVWASHVLEHQPNPGRFLRKCFRDVKDGGIFAVTVPPLKHAIVGGHVNLYNAGLLLYQMILAGFDCSEAAVRTYGYNISVIVRKKAAELPKLAMDQGDIERLAKFFPVEATQGFDGRIDEVNWTWR